MVKKTLAIILAGGSGRRLFPLTDQRAKPAVPFGGKYRIIDFALTNCLHSGLRQILVLTQYKSHSLHRHLRDGWSIFNPELGEYVTPVPPQMRTGERWYSGTADAIRQNTYIVERSGAEQVLILSGDHIYRMDYAAFLAHHKKQNADITVACIELPIGEAQSFGVMSVDKHMRVQTFEEKPANPKPLPDNPERALVSMGVYVFSTTFLIDILLGPPGHPSPSHDFGMDILPEAIRSQNVFAYRFGRQAGRVSQDRFWRDVGTIDAFYEANMALLEPVPPLNLYQDDWPIRTYEGQNPPARTVPGASGRQAKLVNSILASGTVVAGGHVHHSILFPKVSVDDKAHLDHSIVFEGTHIGAGARLHRCIIDKNVHIPPHTEIGLGPPPPSSPFTHSPGGITVVPKAHAF